MSYRSMLFERKRNVAEIVNLRRVRKERARADRRSDAEANRAKHGTSRADRERSQAERQSHDRTVDGAKRESPIIS